jgi:hypothetical protein
MAEFEIVMTERFNSEAANAIAAKLRRHILVGEPQFYFRKALGEFPQFIQLIGDQTIWKTAFGVAATAFLGRLGYRLADITWDKISNLGAAKSIQPLVETARVFAEANRQIDTPVTLALGINIVSRYTPAFVYIQSDNPRDIAFAIAICVTQIDAIIEALEADSQAKAIIGDPIAEVTDNGEIRLKWLTHANNGWQRRETVIK